MVVDVKINIVAVGKIKEKFLREGIDEFLKRLSRYAKVKIVEVADEKIPVNPSEADLEAVKKREADKIKKYLTGNSLVVALAIQGKQKSSEELAQWMKELMIQGKSEITFVIGGAVGLHKSILDLANYLLSFSKLTFTHQMIRMILLEQIYRGFKIMRGEPYHK